MKKLRKLIFIACLLIIVANWVYENPDARNAVNGAMESLQNWLPDVNLILPEKEEGSSSEAVIEDSTLVKCQLIKVVDGDTLIVVYDNKQTKVRMIGIDTPESVHSDESKNTVCGTYASDYTKSLLADVDYVYLEFDQDMYDTYDRLLAYVYTDAEEEDFTESLNCILVTEGYAINKEYPPNTTYAYELDIACEYAKNNGLGLWEMDGIENVWN